MTFKLLSVQFIILREKLHLLYSIVFNDKYFIKQNEKQTYLNI